MVAMGSSPLPVADEIVPLSDAAGVVEEVGESVHRVAVGDRVVVTFNSLNPDPSAPGKPLWPPARAPFR